jgi:hypothetical protein
MQPGAHSRPPSEIMDETLTQAMQAMDRDITRLRMALEMIAGRRPCPDNLLGNADIARLALDKAWPELKTAESK